MPGVPHGRFERVEVDLAELTRRNVRRRPVEATLRRAIADEVLRRRHDPVGERGALEAAHERDAHLSDEMRVLAERLLGAAPARVAAHVEHRREALVGPDRAHLARERRPPSP